MEFKARAIKLFPFVRWGRSLTVDIVKADIVAGVTGALIVLPQGVAFAAIAGMPAEYGLYTSMVPAIVAALFGSSWHLVSGPTTAASVVMFSSLSVLALPGSADYISLAITLAFMVGVLQLAMGVVRLGSLIKLISHTVVIGFTAGAACLIAAKQLRTFLGLDVIDHEHWVETVGYSGSYWDQIHPMVMLVALITLLTGLLTRKKFRTTNMILALSAGSASAVFLNRVFGEATTRIQMISAIPSQLPPLSVPNFSLDVFRDLSSLALVMTLFALTESVSIARSISVRSRQPIESNQEFIGQGLSNLIGSFFSAYVATGSFNRSGANYDAGARSPLAAAFAGLFLILIVLAVADFVSYLPRAAISGLLLLVAWRLIDFKQIRKILSTDKNESMVLAITFFSTLLLELEFAILLGVILSLMIFLRRTSRPKLLPRVPDPLSDRRKFVTGVSLPECPQLKILRLDDSLYFGSVTYVGALLRQYREHYPEQAHLLLLTKGINQIDIAGAELLINETRERRMIGGDIYLYRLKDSASRVMQKGGYLDEIGAENVYDSKSDAIIGIFQRLDRSICASCKARIFNECQTVPVETSQKLSV